MKILNTIKRLLNIIAELPIGSATREQDVTIFIVTNIFSFTMYLHRPHFRLGGKDV